MTTVSPPAELLAEVATGLLASAAELGHSPDVVATTSGALFGYGFVVPQDVFDHWFAGRGDTAGAVVMRTEEPEVAKETPVSPVAKRTGRGVRKAVADGPEV